MGLFSRTPKPSPHSESLQPDLTPPFQPHLGPYTLRPSKRKPVPTYDARSLTAPTPTPKAKLKGQYTAPKVATQLELTPEDLRREAEVDFLIAQSFLGPIQPDYIGAQLNTNPHIKPRRAGVRRDVNIRGSGNGNANGNASTSTVDVDRAHHFCYPLGAGAGVQVGAAGAGRRRRERSGTLVAGERQDRRGAMKGFEGAQPVVIVGAGAGASEAHHAHPAGRSSPVRQEHRQTSTLIVEEVEGDAEELSVEAESAGTHSRVSLDIRHLSAVQSKLIPPKRDFSTDRKPHPINTHIANNKQGDFHTASLIISPAEIRHVIGTATYRRASKQVVHSRRLKGKKSSSSGYASSYSRSRGSGSGGGKKAVKQNQDMAAQSLDADVIIQTVEAADVAASPRATPSPKPKRGLTPLQIPSTPTFSSSIEQDDVAEISAVVRPSAGGLASGGMGSLPQFESFLRSPASVGSEFSSPTPSPTNNRFKRNVEVEKQEGGGLDVVGLGEAGQLLTLPQISPFSSFSGLHTDWIPISPRSASSFANQQASSAAFQEPASPAHATGATSHASHNQKDKEGSVPWPIAGGWKADHRSSLPTDIGEGRRKSSVVMEYEPRERFHSMPEPVVGDREPVREGEYLASQADELLAKQTGGDIQGTSIEPALRPDWTSPGTATVDSGSIQTPPSPSTPVSPTTHMILHATQLDDLTGGALPIMASMLDPADYTPDSRDSSVMPKAHVGLGMEMTVTMDREVAPGSGAMLPRQANHIKHKEPKQGNAKHPFAFFGEGDSSLGSTQRSDSLLDSRRGSREAGGGADDTPTRMTFHPFAASKKVEHHYAVNTLQSVVGVPVEDMPIPKPNKPTVSRPIHKSVDRTWMEWPGSGPERMPGIKARKISREKALERAREAASNDFMGRVMAATNVDLTPPRDGSVPMKTGFDGNEIRQWLQQQSGRDD